MKRQISAITAALLSLMPLGQPLLIRTGVAFTSSSMIFFTPEKVKADEAKLLYERGLSNGKSGNFLEAINNFNELIKKFPNHKFIYLAYADRGVAKVSLGKVKEGILDYNKAIKLNPSYFISYYNRGNAKSQLEDYKGAIFDYNKAIELNPNDSSLYYNIGTIKVQYLNDEPGAITDFLKAIEVNPNHVNAYKNLGLTFISMGQKKDACKVWEKALSLGHKNAANWINQECL